MNSADQGVQAWPGTSFEHATHACEGDRAFRIAVFEDGSDLSCARALSLWSREAAFREGFLELLRTAPMAAFFWEMPPLTQDNLQRPFEFVIADAPELASMAVNQDAFSAYYAAAREGIAAFDNLGGDAALIIPAPAAAESADYRNLAAFIRTAPAAQQHALWRAVAAGLLARMGQKPLWCSTAGQGVAWLHVRLDSTPKYYSHAPYRAWP